MTEGLYRKLSRGHVLAVPCAEPTAPTRLERLGSMPFKLYSLRGVDTPCYTIGTVSTLLGKSQVTIRSWEQKGWMPLPKVRTAAPITPTLGGKSTKGNRLYTKTQVEYLVTAYEACYLDDPKKANWDRFRQLLRNYPSV